RIQSAARASLSRCLPRWRLSLDWSARSSRIPFARKRSEVLHFFHESLKLFERKRVRAIGKRFSGIVVHFKKHTVDARRSARARECFDKFRLAATSISLPTRQLHRMRHVEDDRISQLA